jgi:hypothetical protein
MYDGSLRAKWAGILLPDAAEYKGITLMANDASLIQALQASRVRKEVSKIRYKAPQFLEMDEILCDAVNRLRGITVRHLTIFLEDCVVDHKQDDNACKLFDVFNL